MRTIAFFAFSAFCTCFGLNLVQNAEVSCGIKCESMAICGM
ncbi:hypothetical protein HMPREF1579_01409 [Gardnerella vaginalis JCP8066]|nr:hypothetical protein HMPREF1579_01409 [Gardnerella vaginalis JCP8066]